MFTLGAALSTNAISALFKVRKELRLVPTRDERYLIGSVVYTIKAAYPSDHPVVRENKRDSDFDYYTVQLDQLATAASVNATVTWLPRR